MSELEKLNRRLKEAISFEISKGFDGYSLTKVISNRLTQLGIKDVKARSVETVNGDVLINFLKDGENNVIRFSKKKNKMEISKLFVNSKQIVLINMSKCTVDNFEGMTWMTKSCVSAFLDTHLDLENSSSKNYTQRGRQHIKNGQDKFPTLPKIQATVKITDNDIADLSVARTMQW